MDNPTAPQVLLFAGLLYEGQAPTLNKDHLTKALRQRCGAVDPFGEPDNLFFAFPDHRVDFSDVKSIPAQALILDKPDGVPTKEAIEEALQQTYEWEEAKDVVTRCQSSIMINDMMSSNLERKERLALFHNIVQAVLSIAPCQAIHWMTSGRLVEPQAYLDSKQGSSPDPLYPAVNVRMFRIQNHTPGDMLMDTLGLSQFRMPDIQCHFNGLDPSSMAGKLYSIAYYLFDQGDVIEDGHTVEGIEPGQKWKCQHEVALVGPEREVLDINPGPPYAAGNRP